MTTETPSETQRVPRTALPWLHAASAGLVGIVIAFLAPRFVIGALFGGPIVLVVVGCVILVAGAAAFAAVGAAFRGRRSLALAWTIVPYLPAVVFAYVTSEAESGGEYRPELVYPAVFLTAVGVPAVCALLAWRGVPRLVGGIAGSLSVAGVIAYAAFVGSTGPLLHVSQGTAQDAGTVRPFVTDEPGFHLSTLVPPTSYAYGAVATTYDVDQADPTGVSTIAFSLEVQLKLDESLGLPDYDRCDTGLTCDTVDGVTTRVSQGGYDITRHLDDGSMLRISVQDYLGVGTDTLIPQEQARRILDGAVPMDDEQFARFLFPGAKGCVVELGVCLDGSV